MPEKDIVKELLLEALMHTFTHDKSLLNNDSNERSLTHRFAVYIENLLPRYFPDKKDYSVDCEYNRDGSIPKKMMRNIETMNNNDTHAHTVFPDIIVHKRGVISESNFLVIEAKKTSTVTKTNHTEDIEKLKIYKEKYKYDYCYIVIFPIKKDPKKLNLEDYIREVDI